MKRCPICNSKTEKRIKTEIVNDTIKILKIRACSYCLFEGVYNG